MKKILTLLALLILLGSSLATAQNRKFAAYGIGFYNLENLFDTLHDEGKSDYDFLPEGDKHWDNERYSHKLQNMARVLSDMGTDKIPAGCAVIGVCEVENAHCLEDLCNQEPLKKRNFNFVHIEGADRRGSDCALLYNPRFFSVRNVKLVPYVNELPRDSNYRTRGFLTVSGTLANEHVTFIVNDLPSRFSSSRYRERAGSLIRAIKDSLLRDDPGVKIIIMGDMNDNPQNTSMAVSLGAKANVTEVEKDGLWNPWFKRNSASYYDGDSPSMYDQIILSYSLLDPQNSKDYTTLKYLTHQVFLREYFITQAGISKGLPLRTFIGTTWLDGYSDHFPVVLYLVKEVNK